MERIERNGGPEKWGSRTPETVFVFDIFGAVHEVVCDLPPAAARRRPVPEAELSSNVIQHWLAGFAIALLGLGVLAEPSAALAEAAASAVVSAW